MLGGSFPEHFLLIYFRFITRKTNSYIEEIPFILLLPLHKFRKPGIIYRTIRYSILIHIY